MLALIADAKKKSTLALCHAIREEGESCAFFGMVSSDNDGRAFLENLVNDDILFDPGLCCCPAPQENADASLTSPLLLAALGVNTDVRLAILDGKNDEARKALLAYKPRPVIVSTEIWEGADILCTGNRVETQKSQLVVTESQLAFVFSDGTSYALASSLPSSEKIGRFFALLHRENAFGVDGRDPVLHLDEKSVKAALDALADKPC